MSRPQKGDPDWPVWIAAVEVAAAAPLRKGSTSHSAQIPWSLIRELREALEANGVDWRKARS